MRVIVNCTGGSSHSMMLLEQTTVLDVKQYIGDKEGIPAQNQALRFAGRQLGPDKALLLDELQLDSYSLAHEVVVYMQPQLSQPVHVYLSASPGSAGCRMFPEVVEAASSLANIQDLLLQRQLTCRPFPPAVALGRGPSQCPAQPAAGAAGVRASSGSMCTGSGVGSPCSSARTSAAESHRGDCSIGPGSSNVVVNRQDGTCCSKVCVDEACSIQELLEAIWEVEGQAPTTLHFYQAQDGCLHVVYGIGGAAE